MKTMRSVNPDPGPIDVDETVDTCAAYSVTVATLVCLGVKALKARRAAGHADPVVGGLPLSKLTQINLDKPIAVAAEVGRHAGYGALRMTLPEDHPWASPDYILGTDTICQLLLSGTAGDHDDHR